MEKIRTVCGDIAPSALGETLVHEHTILKISQLAGILVRSLPDMSKGATGVEGGADIGREMESRKSLGIEVPQQSMSGLLSSFWLPKSNPASKLSKEAYYTNELKEFKLHGGSTICDCSPISMGLATSSDVMQRMSKASGVNLLTCVGYYVRPSIPKSHLKRGERFMEDRLSRFMEEGDGKSDARPGFVKCAISYLKDGEICPEEWTAVTAGANVAKKYGCSLHIHTAFPLRRQHIWKMAEHLIQDVKMDPSKVIFCHIDGVSLGDSNPTAHICADGYDREIGARLMDMGFNIGLDTWSVASDLTEENFSVTARYRLLCDFLSSGYGSQIVLGHDTMAPTRGVQNSGGGYIFCPDYLKEKAKTETLIQDNLNKLLVENPARILTMSN